MSEPIVYRLKRSTSSGNFIGKTGEHCGPRCILPEVDADEIEVTIVQLPSVRERRAEALRELVAADHPLDNIQWALNKFEAIDRGDP